MPDYQALSIQIVSDFRNIADNSSTECGSDDSHVTIENVVFDAGENYKDKAKILFVNLRTCLLFDVI